jgi:hypothetical protein
MKSRPLIHHEGEVQVTRGAGDPVTPNVMKQEISSGGSNQHVPELRSPKERVDLEQHRGYQRVERKISPDRESV